MRERCACCGARIKPHPVEGTDPDEAHGSWYEIYECENGCTGRLEYETGRGVEASGALAEDQQVIA
ncbi:hypothetical protein GRX03_12015 [Halovenus sp. WSH3]|uniref:Uncharacterized protein n=1 Tax=Halovenus carboxidivorans TaxID=2692199 RepID=A0A6B0T2V4_9EURY|nr:hypothetical protein [Halovenus carboxidivorans]MXR52325.1 hypothetical protein [Halovenus carboxidivorans]